MLSQKGQSSDRGAPGKPPHTLQAANVHAEYRLDHRLAMYVLT